MYNYEKRVNYHPLFCCEKYFKILTLTKIFLLYNFSVQLDLEDRNKNELRKLFSGN